MHLTTGVFLRRLLLRAVWALPIAGLITFGNFGLGHGTFYVAQTNATTTRGEPVTPEAHRPTAAPSAPSKRPASPKPASPKAAPPAPAPPAPAKPAAPADLGRSWIASHGSPDLGLHAGAAVLLDPDSGQVLWERDPHSRRAPASLTKIVTVMVALDHAPPDRSVVVPDAAQPQPDWTAMGLTPGETVSVRDLLYGVFLLSGNDAAETLAQTLMPRDQFVAAMNAKVSELGLHDTHFANPTGLDEPEHYSSAYDLAVISAHLEKRYAEAAAIASVPAATLPPTSGHKAFQMTSLNKLLTWPYPGANGLKTGYTYAAGGCVAGTAVRGGHRLVSVVLNSDVFFSDASHLFDYGFSSGFTPGS